MKLPIRTFWLLDRNINRLLAEKDLRALSIAANSQSSEGYTQIRENLVIEMGEPMKLDPIESAVRDESGFEDLKLM